MVAIFGAVMLFVVPQARAIAYGIEIVATFAVIASFTAANKGEWQRKWLSYRYLGEGLRALTSSRGGAALFFVKPSLPRRHGKPTGTGSGLGGAPACGGGRDARSRRCKARS